MISSSSSSSLPLLLQVLVVVVVVVVVNVVNVKAHTRLECPRPLSGQTGNKEGPCDVTTDNPIQTAHPLKAGAFNTITWLESLPHPGAPARFALSLDGSLTEGYESCLLLDHVPHDEFSQPSFPDELSWHRSAITLWIPDVYCERCFLQLITVMSDLIHGVPDQTYCAYKGRRAAAHEEGNGSSIPTCPVVYHSCAPVSINGTIPRNSMTECNTTDFESKLDWPVMSMMEQSGLTTTNYSVYYAKGNPGIYSSTDATLRSIGAPLEDCPSFVFCNPALFFHEILSAPVNAKYATLEGSCAAMVNTPVQRYELPSAAPSSSSSPSSTFGEKDDATTVIVPSESPTTTTIGSPMTPPSSYPPNWYDFSSGVAVASNPFNLFGCLSLHSSLVLVVLLCT